jgi:hypothetical protein
MGKKDKNTTGSSDSGFTGAGTLRLKREDFDKAKAQQGEVQMRGAGGPDFVLKSEYTGTVTLLIRGESNGRKTKGSPNFRTEVTIDAPADYAGRKANVFNIAHDSTSTSYLKFLHAVLGIKPEDIESDSEGYLIIPVPSAAQLDAAMGKTVTVVCNGSSKREGTEYMNFDFDFVVGADPKKAKKDKKKSAE